MKLLDLPLVESVKLDSTHIWVEESVNVPSIEDGVFLAFFVEKRDIQETTSVSGWCARGRVFISSLLDTFLSWSSLELFALFRGLNIN